MKLYKVTIEIRNSLGELTKQAKYIASENLIDVIEEFPDATAIQYIDEVQVI